MGEGWAVGGWGEDKGGKKGFSFFFKGWMKIGLGKGDWRYSSHFQKLEAIYTKDVSWAFNKCIIKHISSPLSFFSLFSFKFLFLSNSTG